MAEHPGASLPENGGDPPPLTEKQMKKAAKKQAKMAKFEQKVAKQKEQATPTEQKSDKKKGNKEILQYDIPVAKGDKKGKKD
jgi:hypothetical protein